MARATFCLALALALAAAPARAAAPDGGAAVEIVVVFNKGVARDRADAVLKKLGWDFHEGSDSSHGKKYFYDHGPQFLVQVPEGDLARFNAAVKRRSEIFETFKVDRTIQKD